MHVAAKKFQDNQVTGRGCNLLRLAAHAVTYLMVQRQQYLVSNGGEAATAIDGVYR